MNLINDLDTDIAFAVLIEKKHHEKINSKDLLPLLKRVNDALEDISKNENIIEPQVDKRFFQSVYQ